MTTFSKTVRPLTVASYNVHQCVGLDGQCDPRRIAQVIQELDADIVGLQEVHSQIAKDSDAHQLEFLADATGMNAVAGPTLYRPDGNFGNALLTNAPLLEERFIELSVPGREPRGGIDADVAIAGEKLRVFVTHLGLRAAERRWQVQRLLTFLTEERRDNRPIVLLGDINEWLPRARSLRWLENYFGGAPAPRTFPAWCPVAALDRIWTKPQEALGDIAVHSSPLARIASDHLPVAATLPLYEVAAAGCRE